MICNNRVLLYGDVSPNIIDGSSIWLVSMAESLSLIFDEVHVLLKDTVRDERLVGILDALEGVQVHPCSEEPGAGPLQPNEAVDRLAVLAGQLQPSAVVIRGSAVCLQASEEESIGFRLWSYITDLPFPISTISPGKLNSIGAIVRRSHRIFVQTESARSYLEGLVPEASGKCILLTPMIPDDLFVSEDGSPPPGSAEEGEAIELVYSGKFAKAWMTLEMLELPQQLAQRGITARLTMIGDKFQGDPSDRSWPQRMREALELAHSDPGSGVTWLGGLSRSDAVRAVAQADYGLGWRTEALNASLELSTKMLEYCAAGTPAIVNRNDLHEEVLGEDYPLLLGASTPDEVARVLREAAAAGPRAISASVRTSIQEFAVTASARRLQRSFQRGGALSAGDEITAQQPGTAPRRIKLVVVSHDFKFLGEILSGLQTDPRFEVRVDHWKTLHDHDEEASQELLEWADVILCEWCGPNAVWYSNRKRDDQRLVVRLHRFEVNGPWMSRLQPARIDRLIFVSAEQMRQSTAALERLREAPGQVLPNTIDVDDLERRKVPDAQFHLGVLGLVPFVKRPDRALDVLEELLRHDDRYALHLRGRMPWEYPHEWAKPLQQQVYLDFFSRVRTSDSLRESVVFEPFGADVGSWFRRIGVILSPSSFESFHLATAEGMASGSVPVVWARPGAAEIFGEDNVCADTSEIVSRILSLRDPVEREARSASAKAAAAEWDIAQVYPGWVEALLGEALSARLS